MFFFYFNFESIGMKKSNVYSPIRAFSVYGGGDGTSDDKSPFSITAMETSPTARLTSANEQNNTASIFTVSEGIV